MSLNSDLVQIIVQVANSVFANVDSLWPHEYATVLLTLEYSLALYRSIILPNRLVQPHAHPKPLSWQTFDFTHECHLASPVITLLGQQPTAFADVDVSGRDFCLMLGNQDCVSILNRGCVRIKTPELLGLFPGENRVGPGFVIRSGQRELLDLGGVCVVRAAGWRARVCYLMRSQYRWFGSSLSAQLVAITNLGWDRVHRVNGFAERLLLKSSQGATGLIWWRLRERTIVAQGLGNRRGDEVEAT